MLTRYRAAFTPPGSLAFSAAGALSRFVIAVYPIAIVLIISARTGDYGYAGVVSGVYVLGAAFGNPLSARLTDRLGQRRVLLPFLLANACAVAVFAALITAKAPLWTMLLPAFAMGFTLMDVGALIRARWSCVWPADAPQRTTAYSVESTIDELIFVVGPLTGTLLALHLKPALALGVTVALMALGRLWLASRTDTEPPSGLHETGRAGSALRQPGMPAVAAFAVCVGGLFGAGEVVMVAFCGQHGERSSSGWVLAAFALGSGVAGICYGAVHWQATLMRRFIIAALAFGALPLLYLAADSVSALAVISGIVGLGTAPTLIAAFGLVDRIVPVAQLTEGLTWVGTGLSVGYGLGAAGVGGIADAHGAHDAFWVAIGCSAAAAMIAGFIAARHGAREVVMTGARPD